MSQPPARTATHLCLEHDGIVRRVAFTPDGDSLLTAAFDGTFRQYDSDGELLRRWDVPGLNSALSVSPDGALMAGGNADGQLMTWDLRTGEQTVSHHLRQGNVYDLAFSPDGRTLAAACHTGAVVLWDVGRRKPGAALLGHQGRVWAVAFSPDGRQVASGDEHGRLILWEQGEEVRNWHAYPRHLGCLAFSPDGSRLASIGVLESYVGPEGEGWGSGKHLALWRPQTGRAARRPASPQGHCLAYSRDGPLLATGHRGHGICIWDARRVSPLRVLLGHTDAVGWLSFAPDGRLASCGGDRTARIWPAEAVRGG